MSIGFDKDLTRREFITTTAGAAAGLYGLSMLKGSPSNAASPEVTMLSWNHFVPTSDAKLKEQFEAFGKAKNANLRLDTIAHLQLPAKKAAEAQAKAGHDLWFLDSGDTELYKEMMVDVTDLADELGKKYGGWLDFGKEISVVDGKWKGIPWYFVSFPIVIRTDLFQEVGEKIPPDTWEDVLRAGTKLKKMGHPVGIQLGHSADANAILRGIMWSYGTSEVAADGKTITINNPKTVEAVEFVKKLYKDALDPEVLAWDDASNNRCITSGKCSIILNPISAYKAAEKAQQKIKKTDGTEVLSIDVLNHYLPPKGPAGRHMYAFPLGIGIMNWTKNVDLAKEFIRYHYQKENFDAFITASDGYNQPLLKAYATHPIWGTNPKYAFAPEIGKYSHTQGYPGTPTKFSQVVAQLYIIPDMFGSAATGKMSTKEAIEWAEKEIKEVYAGRKEVVAPAPK